MATKKGAAYKGEMSGGGMPETFAKPGEAVESGLHDMAGEHDLHDYAGLRTSGYLKKKGEPYGEGAKFNHLPPGMDISNQADSDIRDMPYKEIVSSHGYPGDGYTGD